MAHYRIQLATATHKGDRPYQQDRVQILQHPYVPRCLMVVVADGMGGSSGGSMAATQTVDTARQLFQQFDPAVNDPTELLQRLVNEAHAVIRMLKVSSELEPHTTLAAYVVMPDGMCFQVHSGDSRIYHFRRGRLLTRTRDHSYVQTLVDSGQIDESQALTHPKRNLLVSCLGMAGAPQADAQPLGVLGPQDVVLSCSDGLWGYVQDDELAKITHSLTPADACQQLIDLARERAAGRGDNISIAILKTTPAEAEHGAAAEHSGYSPSSHSGSSTYSTSGHSTNDQSPGSY